MNTDFDIAVETIGTDDPIALFGPPPPPGEPPTRQAKESYRRFARLLHPDRAPRTKTTQATTAFARLGEWWRQHQHRPMSPTGTLTCGGIDYRITDQLATGDLANLYLLRSDGATEADTVAKVARDPADNDLIHTEATALRHLADKGDRRFAAYVPRLVGTFTHHDPRTGIQRQANLLPLLSGFIALSDVIDAHPAGLDPRDAAWMMRRLLVGLGHAHRAGVIHGSVLPEHVMIHPESHGLVIVDWCYRPEPGRPIAAMVSRYRHQYPPEVEAKRPADPSTDLYMAAGCLDVLVKNAQPPRMRTFIRGCLLPRQEARPTDAWRLLSEFDDLLQQLYGQRKFRPFRMPSTHTPR